MLLRYDERKTPAENRDALYSLRQPEGSPLPDVSTRDECRALFYADVVCEAEEYACYCRVDRRAMYDAMIDVLRAAHSRALNLEALQDAYSHARSGRKEK